MTLIVGHCPGRDSGGKHRFRTNPHVTYFDCRGRIVDNQSNPRIFAAMANCMWCLAPMVIYNLGFPSKVSWVETGRYNPWTELRSGDTFEPPLYVIQEDEAALCL